MCNEYEHDIQVALSRSRFWLKTDSQATMGGLISAPLSAVLVPDTVSNAQKPWWWWYFDGWWVRLYNIYIIIYNYNQSHPIRHFLQQFPSGRNLPGRLLWQLPCDQLLFGAHLQKAVLKEIAAEAVIASCLYTVGKLAGSGTASSSINFKQLLSFLPAAQQFTHRPVQVSSVQASRCILIWLQALSENLHLRLVQRAPVHETQIHDLYDYSFMYILHISPQYSCEVFHVFSFDPLQTADYHKTQPVMPSCLLYCKQSHDECHDVGLHYCLGSLACFNGCLKPSYTAVKNGLNLDPQVPQVIMVLQFSLYKIASVGYPPFLRRKTSSGLRSSGCLGPAANWT